MLVLSHCCPSGGKAAAAGRQEFEREVGEEAARPQHHYRAMPSEARPRECLAR